MNKVQKLKLKLAEMEKKTRLRINRIQAKCKHKNTEQWSAYGGIYEQCKDCDHWLR